MIYTDEFSKTILRYSSNRAIEKIDQAIQNKRHNSVRIALEDDLDDRSLYIGKNIREDKVLTHKGRKKAYSLFMNEYLKTLDNDSINRR